MRIFPFMVSARNQLAIFLCVTYKYAVDAQVINDVISHNNNNKVRGNKHDICISKVGVYTEVNVIDVVLFTR